MNLEYIEDKIMCKIDEMEGYEEFPTSELLGFVMGLEWVLSLIEDFAE